MQYIDNVQAEQKYLHFSKKKYKRNPVYGHGQMMNTKSKHIEDRI